MRTKKKFRNRRKNGSHSKPSAAAPIRRSADERAYALAAKFARKASLSEVFWRIIQADSDNGDWTALINAAYPPAPWEKKKDSEKRRKEIWKIIEEKLPRDLLMEYDELNTEETVKCMTASFYIGVAWQRQQQAHGNGRP